MHACRPRIRRLRCHYHRWPSHYHVLIQWFACKTCHCRPVNHYLSLSVNYVVDQCMHGEQCMLSVVDYTTIESIFSAGPLLAVCGEPASKSLHCRFYGSKKENYWGWSKTDSESSYRCQLVSSTGTEWSTNITASSSHTPAVMDFHCRCVARASSDYSVQKLPRLVHKILTEAGKKH